MDTKVLRVMKTNAKIVYFLEVDHHLGVNHNLGVLDRNSLTTWWLKEWLKKKYIFLDIAPTFYHVSLYFDVKRC